MLRSRRQVPACALEEIRAGVLDPGGLGPGERVAADEALVGAERGDDVALGRADVGDDRVGPHGLERLGRELRQARRPGPRRRPTLGALAGRGERARRPRSIAPRARRRARASPGRGRSRRPRRRAAAGRRARSSLRSGRRRGRRSSFSAAPRLAPRPRAGAAASTVVVPVHAGVGDRLAVDEVAAVADVLAALDQEGLEHDADDRAGCRRRSGRRSGRRPRYCVAGSLPLLS